MIRRGKTDGWLHLPTDAALTWAVNSGVQFKEAAPSLIPGRGRCLVATRDLAQASSETIEILSVAEELVLSLDTIQQHAKFDQDLREVLQSLGEFGRRNLLGHQTPRGSILTFLLFQVSLSCPDLLEKVGVHSAFTDYVKTLPSELLPTFWFDDELKLLIGTTLAPAVSAKLKSLQREYDLLCESAAHTRWFRAVQPVLEFDDWLQVDAMFRSRALEFHGSCMVPGLDIASHASGDSTNTYYDRHDGICSLYLLPGKEISKGQEVTISYGDEKGACEMLFSYGFIEDQMDTAETLFLSLTIPESDLARHAKARTAGCAPGFKIIDMPVDGTNKAERSNDGRAPVETDADRGNDNDESNDIDWTGDYVWYLCVTPEDGLQFEYANTVDGEEELQATFNGQELQHGASDLRRLLAQSELWDVYRLRAIVILQQRVYDQLQLLYETQDQIEAVAHGEGASIREQVYQLSLTLRRLEFDLLEKAYNAFEAQKLEIASSQTVQQYLAEVNQSDEEVGDTAAS